MSGVLLGESLSFTQLLIGRNRVLFWNGAGVHVKFCGGALIRWVVGSFVCIADSDKQFFTFFWGAIVSFPFYPTLRVWGIGFFFKWSSLFFAVVGFGVGAGFARCFAN